MKRSKIQYAVSTKLRRGLLQAAAAFCLLPAVAAVQAQDAWPSKAVRVIVPFAAGGTTDVVARALAKELGDLWGQPVYVENRAGAGGNIGAEVVARAAPDGYTLLMTSGSIFTVNPYMYEKLPFDPKKDFVAVTNVASGPQLLVVANDLPAKTLKEFITLAKSKPRSLNMGSAGVGSQVHMAGEGFADAAGIEVTHVPYKGEGPAYTDLAGGQIQFMLGNIAAASTFVNNGKVRALAVTSKERSKLLPNVPTVAEAGIPGFENTGWFGFMAPAGTPQAVVDKIYRDTKKVLESTEMKARLYVQGMNPVANPPAEFAKAIDEESQKWARVVKNRGLKAN